MSEKITTNLDLAKLVSNQREDHVGDIVVQAPSVAVPVAQEEPEQKTTNQEQNQPLDIITPFRRTLLDANGYDSYAELEAEMAAEQKKLDRLNAKGVGKSAKRRSLCENNLVLLETLRSEYIQGREIEKVRVPLSAVENAHGQERTRTLQTQLTEVYDF